MKPNKEPDIPTSFWNLAKFTMKVIRYNSQYMDHDARINRREINFMNIITHPTLRVILRSGETAVMRCVHPDKKYSHLNNLILMVGSPYGLVVLFGLEKSYITDPKHHDVVTGPVPGMHATAVFWTMFQRFVQRTGRYVKDAPNEGIMKWVLSKDFRKDIQDQVLFDKAAGHKVNDGLPEKPDRATPKPKTVVSNKPANRRPEGKKQPKVKPAAEMSA